MAKTQRRDVAPLMDPPPADMVRLDVNRDNGGNPANRTGLGGTALTGLAVLDPTTGPLSIIRTSFKVWPHARRQE